MLNTARLRRLQGVAEDLLRKDCEGVNLGQFNACLFGKYLDATGNWNSLHHSPEGYMQWAASHFGIPLGTASALFTGGWYGEKAVPEVKRRKAQIERLLFEEEIRPRRASETRRDPMTFKDIDFNTYVTNLIERVEAIAA